MLRFIGSFFGAIFTAFTLGIFFAALTVGAIFFMYSRDLPSHESLAQYAPPTISRIYSTEGQIIDEFAKERRLFVPIEDIPDLVKHAFISAEDKNFYTHHGYDVTGMIAAARDALLSRGKARGEIFGFPNERRVTLSRDKSAPSFGVSSSGNALAPGRPTTVTSAPICINMNPAKGPGPIPSNSTILIPDSGNMSGLLLLRMKNSICLIVLL